MDDKKAKENPAPLEIRSPLEFDLFDSQGKLLYAAGTHLSPEQIAQISNRVRLLQNAAASTVPPPVSTFDPSQWQGDIDSIPEVDATAPYDAAAQARLKQRFEEASGLVEDSVEMIRSKRDPNLDKINEVFDTYLKEMKADPAVVLDSLQRQETGMTADQRLAKRSVKLSILSTLIARTMQVDVKRAKHVSLAGLFHDLALYESLAEAFRGRVYRGTSSREVYRNHPLHSAEILACMEALPPSVRILVTQVHEQIDGSGFPLGLLMAKQDPLSRILNLADAFITLTQVDDGNTMSEEIIGRSIAPADAMAYLLYHTREGHFDRQCMSALMSCSSMYPVGTQVELDDMTTATVLRSNREDVLNPVIRMDRSHEIVDLRHSPRRIMQPSIANDSLCVRLSADQFRSVLWIN